MAAPSQETQEVPDWLINDRKAFVAFQGAEYCINQWKLEMAKIASDALGPQEPEEQQACVDGWIFLEKALRIYMQAAGFMKESQTQLGACIKNMELEMKSQPASEHERLLECIKDIKEFKKAQKEKIPTLEEQIKMIQGEFDGVVTMLKQVAKDQGKTCEELMVEKMQALGMSASSEQAKEALKEMGIDDTADSNSGGGNEAEPQPETPSQSNGSKKNKKKGK